MGEERIWAGTPSSILLVGKVVGSLVFFWLPGAILLWAATQGPLKADLSPEQVKLAQGAAILWMILPFPYLFGKWLSLKCRKYELTTERMRVSTGILSKRTDETELYRVKDLTLEQPFFLRLFGLGNVIMAPSDKSSPTLVLEAIGGAADVRDKIRAHVESQRDRKRVKEVDME